MIELISPAAAREKLGHGEGLLIDVRSPGEYATVHATGARLVPLERVSPSALGRKPGQPLYILCQSGGRARKAAEQLEAAGEENLYVVEGGTRGWEAAGLPVERGKGTPPIERQVHMVVGPLIVLGTVLGFAVDRGFFIIPGLIGLGLTIAGYTGFCGLALFLARMPWNQRVGQTYGAGANHGK